MVIDSQIEQKIFQIKRPHPKLFWLYFYRSLAALIMFPVVFASLLCKYLTLQYQFEEEGVGASWGVFFKKQVFLTYGRIQDIHVSRGIIERWLGLGTVDVQTASGSAGAELSIVGLEEYEQIRDFLYGKMRGAKGLDQPEDEETGTPQIGYESNESLQLLHAIRDELRDLREAAGRRPTEHQGYRQAPKAWVKKHPRTIKK